MSLRILSPNNLPKYSGSCLLLMAFIIVFQRSNNPQEILFFYDDSIEVWVIELFIFALFYL
jgi:hypothetical protein